MPKQGATPYQYIFNTATSSPHDCIVRKWYVRVHPVSNVSSVPLALFGPCWEKPLPQRVGGTTGRAQALHILCNVLCSHRGQKSITLNDSQLFVWLWNYIENPHKWCFGKCCATIANCWPTVLSDYIQPCLAQSFIMWITLKMCLQCNFNRGIIIIWFKAPNY